ncbi:hypothetical protein [Brachyspira sp.]|uniref:hypothetical protein n=1 Tax=Brachyspira sp. TaxID=1977261 RepID=UPI002610F010|nr:hypothetical protein [Brachyspira sp.]
MKHKNKKAVAVRYLENTICLFSKKCRGCTVIDHNVDIYSCDHYVYTNYKIRNI